MLSGRFIGNTFQSSIISIGTKTEIFDITYSEFDLDKPPTYSTGDLLIVCISDLSSNSANTTRGWVSSAFRSQFYWWAKIAEETSDDNFTINERLATGARAFGQMIAVKINGNGHDIGNHENGQTLSGGGYPQYDYDFFYPGISIQAQTTGESIICTAGKKVMSGGVSFTGAGPPLDYVDGGTGGGRAHAWGILRTDDPVALDVGSFNPSENEEFGQYGAAIRFRILNT